MLVKSQQSVGSLRTHIFCLCKKFWYIYNKTNKQTISKGHSSQCSDDGDHKISLQFEI